MIFSLFKFSNDIESPLHEACNNKNLKIVKLLVNNGADIDAKNIISFSFFDFLIKKFHRTFVSLKFITLHYLFHVQMEQQVFSGSYLKKEQISMKLIKMTFHLQTFLSCFFNCNLLHKACQASNIEIVKACIDKGINVNSITVASIFIF